MQNDLKKSMLNGKFKKYKGYNWKKIEKALELVQMLVEATFQKASLWLTKQNYFNKLKK